MTLTNVKLIYLSGNTFPNKDAIRSLGGQYYPDEKHWIITIGNHPLNTPKHRKELEQRLHQLVSNGVVIVKEMNLGDGTPEARPLPAKYRSADPRRGGVRRGQGEGA